MTAIDNRPEIAVLKLVRGDELETRLLDVFVSEGKLHPIDLAGVEEPPGVLLEAKDSGAAMFRDVAADAFEESRSVMQCVREDVHLRIGVVDELPVHPYFFDFFEGHGASSGRRVGQTFAPHTPVAGPNEYRCR